jgi:hypothetical protein
VTVELREVSSESELRDRYRSARARLMPPVPPIIATRAPPPPLPKSPPVAQGKPKPPSILGELSFEGKAALVLSLIPRTAGNLCREVMIVTANVYDITLDDILSQSRLHIICHPRSLAMAICVEVLGFSRSKVGWQFGRDHTTVIQSLRKYGALIRTIEARRSARPPS